jgi:hypothetical protein
MGSAFCGRGREDQPRRSMIVAFAVQLLAPSGECELADRGREDQPRRSMIVAFAMPPPSHMVCRP